LARNSSFDSETSVASACLNPNYPVSALNQLIPKYTIIKRLRKMGCSSARENLTPEEFAITKEEAALGYSSTDVR
jgi:hypothetical protein